MPTLRGLVGALGDEEVRSISRRYLVSNGFDGTLTGIGLAVGAYLSGVPSGATVFKVGVGALVGLVTSAVWSVWEIERAERRSDLQRLERAMHRDLSGTRVERRQRRARLVTAAASGLGPLLGVGIPLLPYLLESRPLSMLQATLLSVALGIALLFAFGAYMGSLSEQNWLVAGARMGLAGLVVALVNVLLPG